MTNEKERADNLINDLDDYAADLRKTHPEAAKKVDQAMYLLMDVRLAVGELMQAGAHQAGLVGPVAFEVLR